MKREKQQKINGNETENGNTNTNTNTKISTSNEFNSSKNESKKNTGMLPYAGDKTGIYGIFAAIASFVTLSITAVVKFFKRK